MGVVLMNEFGKIHSIKKHSNGLNTQQLSTQQIHPYKLQTLISKQTRMGEISGLVDTYPSNAPYHRENKQKRMRPHFNCCNVF